MSAPPGNRPNAAALELRQGEGRTVQEYARDGRDIADRRGLSISQNRLVRLVRRYIERKPPGVTFESYFLEYLDPTGETATANVMRGAR